jgi:hypothetical protein
VKDFVEQVKSFGVTRGRGALVARRLGVLWFFVGLGAAAALWRGATETTTTTEEIFGHSHVVYEDVDRTTDPLLAGASLAVGIIGATGLGLSFAPRSSWAGVAIGGLAIAASTGAAMYVGVGREETPPGPALSSVAQVASALERADLGCEKVATTVPDGRFFSAEARCPIPAELDINDGYDDAVIYIWNEEGRAGWLAGTPNGEVNGAMGPMWLVVCEFESTCTEIQYRIGGRNY